MQTHPELAQQQRPSEEHPKTHKKPRRLCARKEEKSRCNPKKQEQQALAQARRREKAEHWLRQARKNFQSRIMT